VSESSDEAFVLEVLAALEQTGLEALVDGSVAAVLQGSPVTTQDLDLLVRDTPANRRKIEELGQRLGARPREISALTNVLRIDATSPPVDLLFDRLPGNLSFESLRSRSIAIDLAGRTARVASLEDIILSKEAAGRPKDHAQLPILRDTLRVKKALEKP
jgi:predicted nucleotidyltransferase